LGYKEIFAQNIVHNRLFIIGVIIGRLIGIGRFNNWVYAVSV